MSMQMQPTAACLQEHIQFSTWS